MSATSQGVCGRFLHIMLTVLSLIETNKKLHALWYHWSITRAVCGPHAELYQETLFCHGYAINLQVELSLCSFKLFSGSNLLGHAVMKNTWECSLPGFLSYLLGRGKMGLEVTGRNALHVTGDETSPLIVHLAIAWLPGRVQPGNPGDFKLV